MILSRKIKALCMGLALGAMGCGPMDLGESKQALCAGDDCGGDPSDPFVCPSDTELKAQLLPIIASSSTNPTYWFQDVCGGIGSIGRFTMSDGTKLAKLTPDYNGDATHQYNCSRIPAPVGTQCCSATTYPLSNWGARLDTQTWYWVTGIPGDPPTEEVVGSPTDSPSIVYPAGYAANLLRCAAGALVR